MLYREKQLVDEFFKILNERQDTNIAADPSISIDLAKKYIEVDLRNDPDFDFVGYAEKHCDPEETCPLIENVPYKISIKVKGSLIFKGTAYAHTYCELYWKQGRYGGWHIETGESEMEEYNYIKDEQGNIVDIKDYAKNIPDVVLRNVYITCIEDIINDAIVDFYSHWENYTKY